MASRSSFTVNTAGKEEVASTLVIGQTHFGMASVTAVDYLVRHLDSTQIGHVAPEDLPAITPFEDGVPRHHSRLYTIDDTNLTVLVGELFIPVVAAREFAEALLQMVDEQGIEEILVLHGVPFPHGPDEHDVFSVATPEFREKRLADDSFEPLKGGFLDGVVGEVVTQSLDEPALDTGVLLTPTHPPGPDIEAALRLIEAAETLYGFAVDETELRELGEQLEEHYEQLADRMATLSEGVESPGSHDYPVDRMYM